MKNLDDIHADRPEQGFQFPGLFEITAIGEIAIGLEQRMPEILAGIGLTVLAGSARKRPSQEGNYESVSVSFTCPSREMYERAHAVLREETGIRWTL
ncbi:MAG: DUF493 family protein [Dokdonella sp.]